MTDERAVLVPLATGFEEIEAVTLIDVLRRAKIPVIVAGIGGAGPVTGSHGIAITAEAALADVAADQLRMVALPGGLPGAEHLRDDPRLGALIRELDARGDHVVAICAAPIALSAAGVTRGRTVTSYPGFGGQIECGDYREERVVVDGRLITSRGPGTALELALTLVEELAGTAAAARLRTGMLVDAPGTPHRAE